MKAGFNEADRYLMERWAEALEFEQGMQAVQEKYGLLLGKVVEELKERDWWDDAQFKHYTSIRYGCVGFGRKSWDPTNSEGNFPGLWLDDLQLEKLLVDTQTPPVAYVWLRRVGSGGYDLDSVREKILSAASGVLAKFPTRRTSWEDANTIICYGFPEDRQALIQSLFSDEGQAFIDVLVSHAERLAELIPAIDSALRRPAKK